MALTDTAIRATKPSERPYKVYDRDGLFLLINPSGSKLWRWRYRFDGKEKLMALGEYPVVNLAQEPANVTLQLAKSWPPALIRWRSAKLKPRPGRGKPKHGSVRPRTASRRSLANGGSGGLLANLRAMLITSCGAWKRTSSRPSVTSSSTM